MVLPGFLCLLTFLGPGLENLRHPLSQLLLPRADEEWTTEVEFKESRVSMDGRGRLTNDYNQQRIHESVGYTTPRGELPARRRSRHRGLKGRNG